MTDKKADLTGPGIGSYEELENILPQDYRSLLTPRETQQAIYEVKNYIEIPLSISGGIGQSRTYMSILKEAHLGEVSVTVWPKILKEMCAKRNIHVLE